MKKVLVLGANGHIGNALLREFSRQQFEVTAHLRRVRPHLNLSDISADTCYGDLELMDDLTPLVSQFDWIIDAAAPYPTALFLDAAGHQRAEQRMLKLTEAVRNVDAKLVYISTFVTLDRHRQSSVLANHLISRSHPYYVLKRRMEVIVDDAMHRGLNATIIHPSAVMGPYDQKAAELCAIPALLNNQIPCYLDCTLNILDVRDLACAIVQQIEQQIVQQIEQQIEQQIGQQPAGEQLPDHIALFGHDITLSALVDRVCQSAKISRPMKLFKMNALTSIGALGAEAACRLLDVRPPVSALALLLMTESFQPKQPTANVQLRSLDATIDDAISWYQRAGYC